MLTKFKAEVKARFEEDHAPPSSPVKTRREGDGKDGPGQGQGVHAQARTAAQVCVWIV